MKKLALLIVIFLLVISGLLFGWIKLNHKGPEITKRTRFLMDTYCTIQVPGKAEEVDKIIDAAFSRMEEVDQKFNILNPKSPLYHFNNNNTPITDPEIINVIKISQKVNQESEGAFDITVEPLVRLWGFYTDGSMHLPDKEDIRKILNQIGLNHLKITDDKIEKDSAEIHIDLGGIAKGYGIGEAVKSLKNNGLKSALIEAGGQVYAFGTINGQPWKIGIRNPRANGVIAGLAVNKESGISTSGDYERFFAENGVRYHHILDPKTGYPARGLMSMSVITEDPTLADAWSTALFVMGPEKAMQLVRKNPEIKIIIVMDDGKIISCP